MSEKKVGKAPEKFRVQRGRWSVEWYAGTMILGGKGEIACERPADARLIVAALRAYKPKKVTR